jgi:hypothetical protein
MSIFFCRILCIDEVVYIVKCNLYCEAPEPLAGAYNILLYQRIYFLREYIFFSVVGYEPPSLSMKKMYITSRVVLLPTWVATHLLTAVRSTQRFLLVGIRFDRCPAPHTVNQNGNSVSSIACPRHLPHPQPDAPLIPPAPTSSTAPGERCTAALTPGERCRTGR